MTLRRPGVAPWALGNMRPGNGWGWPWRLLLLVGSLATVLHRAFGGLPLNEFILHFEPVYYDREAFQMDHHRVKRNSDISSLRLQLTAHNKLFKMHLQRDSSLFTDDVIFESTRGPISFDTSNIYYGSLEDDDQSFIRGVVTSDGLFDGTVSTLSGDYFIEPALHHFKEPQDFHSLIYKASDVRHPLQYQRCQSHVLQLRRQEEARQQKPAIPTTPEEPFLPLTPAAGRFRLANSTTDGSGDRKSHMLPKPSDARKKTDDRTIPDERHLEDVRTPVSCDTDVSPSSCSVSNTASRKKRWTQHFHNKTIEKRAAIDQRKTTCMLYLQADHLFFDKFGSEEACIEVITRHVQRVNTIYKVTDFDQDGKPDNISFMIKRIKVHTNDALNDKNYRFPGNYGVEKFLELFSEEDYDAFCLAYMFTYRDFEGGTLGLAWTGDLKNAGGVCEKNGHYRGSLKSLNTGIVTLLNYGKHVPPAVSHVTLAHEIGHNFGSPHDPEHNKICTPGGDDGNYIMFARATSGDKKNNNRFSPCSLNSISPVLNAKARDSKGCFTEPKAAICGNGVVEDGEDCDCGWEEDCKEECCFPMHNHPSPNQPPCRLKAGKTCSPSQGPCCTQDCRLKFGDKCRDDNGCRDSSYCNGHGPVCPASTNKPNKTICNEEFVCFMGECTGSICIAYGLELCQCIAGAGDPNTKACELCCKMPGDDQPCLSSFDWNVPPYDIPDMFAKPGTPCNNYNGYCDVFQKCREVDPSGPLATLRKLLLSNESIASLKKWVIDHWYAMLFILLGVITILVVVIRVCGKTPRFVRRSKKSHTVLHSSNGGVHLPSRDDPFHTIHPTAIRKKLPLKKKVREYHHQQRNGLVVNKKKPSKHAKRTKNKDGPTVPLNNSVGNTPSSSIPAIPSLATTTSLTIAAASSKTQAPSSGNRVVSSHSMPILSTDGKGITTHKPVTAKLMMVKGRGKRKGSHRQSHGAVKSRSKSPQKTSEHRSKSLLHLNKSKSNSEVKVQMVYRPPFKFSFQISKGETNSKSKSSDNKEVRHSERPSKEKHEKQSKDKPSGMKADSPTKKPSQSVSHHLARTNAKRKSHPHKSGSELKESATKNSLSGHNQCNHESREKEGPGQLHSSHSGLPNNMNNGIILTSDVLEMCSNEVLVPIPSDMEVLISDGDTGHSENETSTKEMGISSKHSSKLESTYENLNYEDSCV